MPSSKKDEKLSQSNDKKNLKTNDYEAMIGEGQVVDQLSPNSKKGSSSESPGGIVTPSPGAEGAKRLQPSPRAEGVRSLQPSPRAEEVRSLQPSPRAEGVRSLQPSPRAEGVRSLQPSPRNEEDVAALQQAVQQLREGLGNGAQIVSANRPVWMSDGSMPGSPAGLASARLEQESARNNESQLAGVSPRYAPRAIPAQQASAVVHQTVNSNQNARGIPPIPIQATVIAQQQEAQQKDEQVLLPGVPVDADNADVLRPPAAAVRYVVQEKGLHKAQKELKKYLPPNASRTRSENKHTTFENSEASRSQKDKKQSMIKESVSKPWYACLFGLCMNAEKKDAGDVQRIKPKKK